MVRARHEPKFTKRSDVVVGGLDLTRGTRCRLVVLMPKVQIAARVDAPGKLL